MYSVKSYEFTLMHLLTIVIFAHSVKIQRTFFLLIFIAITDDCEVAQKKQRLGPNSHDIKTAVFSSEQKSANRPKINLYYNVKWIILPQ